MATLSLQQVTPAGLSPTHSNASTGGDKVTPGERTFISVRNAGASCVTVMIDDALSSVPVGAACFDPDVEVVIVPSGSQLIGPFPERRFRGSDGLVAITYSNAASVTIAGLKL